MLPVNAVIALASFSSHPADLISRLRRSRSASMFLLNEELNWFAPACCLTSAVNARTPLLEAAQGINASGQTCSLPFVRATAYPSRPLAVADNHPRSRRVWPAHSNLEFSPVWNPSPPARVAVVPARP